MRADVGLQPFDQSAVAEVGVSDKHFADIRWGCAVG